MKRINIKKLTLLLTIISFVNVGNAQTYTRNINEIAKEINQHKDAVHIFDDWMRDPYVSLGPDGYYYLTCTQYTPESEGIRQPVYRSKDLAKWEFNGFPYSLNDASNYNQYIENNKAKRRIDFDGKTGLKLWAPEMHFIDNRWITVHTSNVGIGNLFYSEGKEYKAPFKDWGELFGKHHDPSLFCDDNKDIWLVSKCAEIQKIKSDLSGFDGEPIKIEPSNRKLGHEGCSIVKFEGKYILFGTGWSTDNMRKGTYNLYYCTADKVEGPYDERKFAGRFLGHGTPFKDKNGKWWCTAFYNANKPVLSEDELKATDFSNEAYSINKQGLTLVPLDFKKVNGDIVVTAIDPAYRLPGKEEVQKFNNKK